jgi:hypothetical protein
VAATPGSSLPKDGLTDDQISAINSAIKAGLERSLQLSVAAELDALQQSSIVVTCTGMRADNECPKYDLGRLGPGLFEG